METLDVGSCKYGFWDVEPLICAAGTFFNLPDGGEVLIEFAAVFASELLVHAVCVIRDGVQNTAAPAESAPDGFLTIAFDAEQHVEDLLGAAFCGELDSVARPCEGGSFDGHFERLKASGHSLHLGHELVCRNGVAEGAAIAWNVGAREPYPFAVVVFADDHRVMESADGRDVGAVLLEGLERSRELVVRSGFLNLPRQGIDAVGDVEEDAALGFGWRWNRSHAIEQGECDGCAGAAEECAARNLPFVEIEVHGVWFRLGCGLRTANDWRGERGG